MEEFLLVLAGGLVAVLTQAASAWWQRQFELKDRKQDAVVQLMRVVANADEPIRSVRRVLDEDNLTFAQALTDAARELEHRRRLCAPERALVEPTLQAAFDEVFRTTQNYLNGWSEALVNQHDFDSVARWDRPSAAQNAFWAEAGAAAGGPAAAAATPPAGQT